MEGPLNRCSQVAIGLTATVGFEAFPIEGVIERLGCIIEYRAFGLNDGMPVEECSSGFCPAGLKTRSGMICFSTVKDNMGWSDWEEFHRLTPNDKTNLQEQK